MNIKKMKQNKNRYWKSKNIQQIKFYLGKR